MSKGHDSATAFFNGTPNVAFMQVGNDYIINLSSLSLSITWANSVHQTQMGGSEQGGVGLPDFGMNYGSIFSGQLSGYVVFCNLLIGGATLWYRYHAKYKVARKLAKQVAP